MSGAYYFIELQKSNGDWEAWNGGGEYPQEFATSGEAVEEAAQLYSETGMKAQVLKATPIQTISAEEWLKTDGALLAAAE